MPPLWVRTTSAVGSCPRAARLSDRRARYLARKTIMPWVRS